MARERTSSRASRFALALACCSFACGTSTHSEVYVDNDAGNDTQVASGVNVCPRIDGSWISPQRIRPGESANIVVRAVDPDLSDKLVCEWRAARGTFNPSDDPVTSYSCSGLGTEPLTITVTDTHGCSSAMTISVECIAN